MTTDRTYFTKKMFIGTVLPAPLSAIGLALAEMGDAILAGHAFGFDGLAAIGFVSPIFLIGAFLAFGLSMGGAVVFGNLSNEGKHDDALKVFNFFVQFAAVICIAFVTLGLVFEYELLDILGITPDEGKIFYMTKNYLTFVFFGIAFEIMMWCLVAYMRYDDGESVGNYIVTASGLLNLSLSAILLFIFHFGIEGCSIAFIVADGLSMLASICYIVKKGKVLKFQRETIKFSEAIKPLRLGFSTSLEYIFESIFAVIAINMLMDIAGSTGVAVYNLVENTALLFIFLYELIGKNAQPIFSTFFVEKNFEELHRTLKYCLIYAMSLGVLTAAVVTFFPQIIDVLFGLDGIKDAELAYHAMRIFCAGTIFTAVSLILQNYYQSEEDEQSTFLIVFLRRCGVIIPLTFILGSFGFYAFWFVFPLSEIITVTIVFIYRRIVNKKHAGDSARVYAKSFTGQLKIITETLNEIDAFLQKWRASEQQVYLMQLAIEEICVVMNEQSAKIKSRPVLTQLTIIAKEDGIFELHMRNDAAELDPFNMSKDAVNEIQAGSFDYIKGNVKSFFYRSYKGFNTITVEL